MNTPRTKEARERCTFLSIARKLPSRERRPSGIAETNLPLISQLLTTYATYAPPPFCNTTRRKIKQCWLRKVAREARKKKRKKGRRRGKSRAKSADHERQSPCTPLSAHRPSPFGAPCQRTLLSRSRPSPTGR